LRAPRRARKTFRVQLAIPSALSPPYTRVKLRARFARIRADARHARAAELLYAPRAGLASLKIIDFQQKKHQKSLIFLKNHEKAHLT